MKNKYLTQGQLAAKLTTQSRRELLISILRNVVLGLLTVVAYLVSISRHRLVQEGKCVKNSICNNCSVFEKCTLPQALSVKQSPMGIKNVRK
jgi:hypothetical protein